MARGHQRALPGRHPRPAGDARASIHAREGIVGDAAKRATATFIETGDANALKLDVGVGTVATRAIALVPLRRRSLYGLLVVGSLAPFEASDRLLLERIGRVMSAALAERQRYEQLADLSEQLDGRQQEIVSRNDELARANRLKSEFLASVSHELRTPLNAILGFSDVLRDDLAGPLTEEQRDFVGEIHDAGDHLLSLINEILDLTKIEAGRMDIDLAAFSPTHLVENAITMLQERATQGRITLDSDLSDAPAEWVADERRVRQILYNLLSNAVKFTEPGGCVTVSCRSTEIDGTPALELNVADNGVGIAPQDLERIFHPFEQADGSATRRHEGTGLGLALVRRLVELHGGRLDVESEVGVGSRFAAFLPSADPCSHGEDDGVTRSAVQTAEGQVPSLAQQAHTNGTGEELQPS